LTLFGLLAVLTDAGFYALEDRSAWFILAFLLRAPGPRYAVLQGALAVRRGGGGMGRRGATPLAREDTRHGPLTAGVYEGEFR
jgi:hypothetical protein